MSSRPGQPVGRVLVTGAGGFIGRHLTRALVARGCAVTALDLQLPDVSPGAEAIQGDVGDAAARAKALREVHTVYHLAACHLGVRTPDAEFERINVHASAALVREAAAAGVQRFVHCSSVGVHGRIADPPADENSPCNPKLVYERTKLAGESAVLVAAEQAGLALVVLRPAWVYGPGCPRTEKLFRAIGRGRFVVAGSGESLRHGVHIDDMLQAFTLAAGAQAAAGQIIIVGDDMAVSVGRWVDEIARLCGARPPRRVPFPLLGAAATLAELAFQPFGIEPPISRRTLEFFTSNTAFRTDRARELLGFAPKHDFASGLAATYEALGRAEEAA